MWRCAKKVIVQCHGARYLQNSKKVANVPMLHMLVVVLSFDFAFKGGAKKLKMSNKSWYICLDF